jgi:hypothetical protein
MTTNFQKHFFETLKSQYTGNLFQKLTEIFGLKKSAIYNKLNGINPLTFDEIYKIGIEFGLSFDTIVYNNPIDKAPFSFYSNSLKFKPKSYSDFLDFTKYQIDRISKAKQLQVTYVSPDIPLVFLLQFPYLLSFKMFMWDITNWQIHSEFDDSMIYVHAENNEFITNANEFYTTYIKAKTCEIISSSIFHTSYQQLKYCIQKGYIKDRLIIQKIIDNMMHLTDFIEEICSTSKKIHIKDRRIYSKNFELYLNDIGTQNELIYASGHNLEVAFSSFETPTFLRSNDPRVTNYLAKSIQRIKDSSILISIPENQKILQNFVESVHKEHKEWRARLEVI